MARRPVPPTADLIRAQLRRLRTVAGLNQEEFGKLVHYSSSKVSAVELGQHPLDEAFLARADAVLDSGDLLVSLLELARRDGAPSWFRPWLDAERAAEQLFCWEPSLIPGLLQTPNYARAVLRLDTTLAEAEVDQRVATRLDRQAILDRAQPPQYIVVLDESVLRRCGEGFTLLMAEQLGHLLACAEKPHISVHVVPADAVLHLGLSGPFTLARSTAGGWVGHLEHQLGGILIDNDEEVARLIQIWESVRNDALPRRQSIDLIKEVVETWS
ncbi:helix-turn-helix domain-containing protein [Micromonospora echinofusca]|uniref:helix-turn-helix domain-containing protein n=1 Tax=Micromonospora echinofusca TaxID=47858 RepID=UPI0027DC336E|nr:helix-turn-helix transcriptional regulator [Micromonospora echinofusca]